MDERKNRGSNFSVTVHYILLVSCVELQFSIGNNASVPDFGEKFFWGVIHTFLEAILRINRVPSRSFDSISAEISNCRLNIGSKCQIVDSISGQKSKWTLNIINYS